MSSNNLKTNNSFVNQTTILINNYFSANSSKALQKENIRSLFTDAIIISICQGVKEKLTIFVGISNLFTSICAQLYES